MSSATSQAQALPEALETDRVRNDMTRHYNPSGPLEQMLVTQIAEAWLCLQQAYETRRRYFQVHDPLEAIAKQFAQYKAVTGDVISCERVWRRAMSQLEKVQKQRQRRGPNAAEQRPETLRDSVPTESTSGTTTTQPASILVAVASPIAQLRESAGVQSIDQRPAQKPPLVRRHPG